MNIYISGPITGRPGLNRAAFMDAERELLQRGYSVCNPFRNGLPVDAPWEGHMRADIRMLCGCDAVLLLEGWEASRGARLEAHIATQLGIRLLDAMPAAAEGWEVEA